MPAAGVSSFSFADVRVHIDGPIATAAASNPTRIQRKCAGCKLERDQIVLGTPGDRLEHEADAVADALTRGLAPPTAVGRVRTTGPHEPSRGHTLPLAYSAHVDRALAQSGHGEPLHEPIRRNVGALLGHDFSDVRVHRDAQADASTRALDARAFTHGRDIWLRSTERPTDVRLLSHELTHVVQQSDAAIGGHGMPASAGALLQRDGPTSSTESFEAFSATQRRFLQDNLVDPAGLDSTVAHRLARLLDAAQQAHRLQTGDVSGMAVGPDTAITLDQRIGETGAEISVMVVTSEGSLLIARRFDMATGSVSHELAYQDVDGNQIESTTSNLGPPRILNRFSLELGPARSELTLPSPEGILLSEEDGTLSPADELDDFNDLLASETATAAGAEGVGSFIEGAVVGDFGENDSWSAIAGQTVVGFIPIAGQIADVRDLLAAFGGVAEGRQGAWLSVGIAGVAFIPGLDFLKGGTRVGRRALREAAQESISEVSEAALKRARRVLSREAVQTARRRLRALATGRIELIQRLTELSTSGAIRQRTRDLVENARNAIRDHMTPQDLSGALRDRLGMPVRSSGSGRTFDHLGEVNTALSAMTDARRALLGELQRLAPDSEGYRLVSREVEALTEIRRRVDEFLETQ